MTGKNTQDKKKAFFQPEDYLPVPQMDLLSWIWDDETHPTPYEADRKIYIDEADLSRSLTKGEARKMVRTIIAGLRKAGVKSGDCVLIHSFNDIYYPMLVLGIVGSGAIYSGTNPAYTARELEHHIITSAATYIIAEPELIPVACVAAKTCGLSDNKIFCFDHHLEIPSTTPAGIKSWRELLVHGEEDWVRFNDAKTAATTVCCRLFSSGTSGLPKAVDITHANFSMQHVVNNEYKAYWPPSFARVLILPLPMFHVASAPLVHFGVLRAGFVSYIMRRFELARFLRAVETYHATDLFLVPPLAIALIMSPLTKNTNLSSVFSLACGAAPLDRSVQKRLLEIVDPGNVRSVPFTQVYGSTETSCVVTKFWYPESDTTGSVGRLIPNLEAKLIDDNGNDISAYGIRGEICLRGPTVIPGYFRAPQPNSAYFDSDGFFHTGDIGMCDAQTKKWYIVDRKKELIKFRASQVAPAEIEGVLLGHPGIIDVAVIGVKPDKGGEADGEWVRAYVVRRPGWKDGGTGEEVQEADLLQFVAANVAGYKRLSGGVRFLPEIPKNPSGKILKRILREWAEKEAKAKL